jgi:putative tricarboxylic transport membrane protein
MGVFGGGEVIWFLSHREAGGSEKVAITGRLWLNKDEWRRCFMPILRGSLVGFIAGLLPGSGSSLGSIMAYTTEQRLSTEPERFGKGAIEAVAAAETANNSATGGALIPMITLGIPGSGTTAVLLVVFLMYGLQPGPRLLLEQPQLMWTIVASLYISNIVLVIYNLPMIPLFTRILKFPSVSHEPVILAFASSGGICL